MKMKMDQRNTQNQKMSIQRRWIIGITLAAVLVIGGLIVFFNFTDIREGFAAGATYYSRGNGDWNDKNNWALSAKGSAATAYPTTGDIVIIEDNTISVNNGNAACSTLTVKGGSQLFIKNGKTLNVAGNVTIDVGSGNNDAELTIEGSKSTLNTGGLFLADKQGGQSSITINVKNNSVLNVAKELTLEAQGGQNNVTLNLMDQAQVAVKGNINLIHDGGSNTAVTTNMGSSSKMSSDGSLVFDAKKAQSAIFTMQSNAELTLGGSISRMDKNAEYGIFNSAGSATKVYFKSDNQQTLAGNGETMTIENLIIDNASSKSPQVILEGNVRVLKSMQLLKGVVQTASTAMIILADDATCSRASTQSYVQGPLQKEGNDAFIFPLGKNGHIGEIGISAPSSTSAAYTAEYYATGPTNKVTNGVKNVSATEYWNLAQNNGSGNTVVTLYWADATYSGVISKSDMRVAYFDPSQNKWIDKGGQGITNNSVSSNSLSNYGAFTFGNNGINPLPVELVRFDAKPKVNRVDLSWSTASEENNDYFNVERSEDGVGYKSIGKVKGKGTTQSAQEYTYIDDNPVYGKAYYRLKQIDFNGAFEYSPVKPVMLNPAKIESISPNPFRDQFTANYNVPEDGQVTMQLVDASGRSIHERKILARKGANKFTYTEGGNLKDGLYILRLISGDEVITTKLIKSNQ